MKLNNKGFTLVELLVMLVVLGILMAITVPNITGILNQTKNNVLIEDVTKMVETAKTKIATKSNISNPQKDKCLVFTLEYLNDSDEFKKGPNDGKYDFYDSFVIVKRVDNKFEYYVRLVEHAKEGDYGVEKAEYKAFKKKYSDFVGPVTTKVGLEDVTELSEVAGLSIINSYCSGSDSIQGFYKEA